MKKTALFAFILMMLGFTAAAQDDCTLRLEYGPGMEGCILNIRNATSGQWFYPADFTDNSITVASGSDLRVNFVEDDFTVTAAFLNGKDISDLILTSSFSGAQSITFSVTESENVLKMVGTKREYGTVDFTGYIINAEGVDFSLTYQGTPFELPEGEAVETDIKVGTLTMPADETFRYIFTLSEKNPKFFFAPKDGYYISALYTITPEDKLEIHSGNSSMTAMYDGTTFYMFVEKLPDPYKAMLNITGNDFMLRISANQTMTRNWGNPGAPSFSSEPGEREFSFVPGYDTPLTFGFMGDESMKPALYLDGAEMTGTISGESGAVEYSVTPFFPSEESLAPEGAQSVITVYNSYKERPLMSGASLQCEEGAEAAFYYSPVMHEAKPEGQAVMAGTLFTVRPLSGKVTVTYKDEVLEADEKGNYTFTVSGNARDNIVKVIPDSGNSSAVLQQSQANDTVTVFSLDGKSLLKNAPVSSLDSLEKGIYVVNGKKTILK